MAAFFRGPYASYVQATHGDGIYFATDKGIIKMNGVDYLGPVANNEVITSISFANDKFIITYTDKLGVTRTQEIELVIISEYTSGIEDTTLKMPNAVGGIAKNTTVGQLNGKTFSQMFDDLLFPSVDPSHGTPSLSGFALNPSTSPVEIGTSVASISEAGLNKATWTTYNNSLAYAGDITSTVYTIKINGTTYTDRTSLPSKYTTVGDQTYKAVVNYAAGPTPVNNKGVERPSLAASASSVTATRTVNVTYPWYASTSSASSNTPVVKQDLISWNATAGQMNTPEFELQPSNALAQVFKIPREASTIQIYDNGSGKWVTEAKDTTYVKTTETISVNGHNVTYYVYTYNVANKGNRGAAKLKVQF